MANYYRAYQHEPRPRPGTGTQKSKAIKIRSSRVAIQLHVSNSAQVDTIDVETTLNDNGGRIESQSDDWWSAEGVTIASLTAGTDESVVHHMDNVNSQWLRVTFNVAADGDVELWVSEKEL